MGRKSFEQQMREQSERLDVATEEWKARGAPCAVCGMPCADNYLLGTGDMLFVCRECVELMSVVGEHNAFQALCVATNVLRGWLSE